MICDVVAATDVVRMAEDGVAAETAARPLAEESSAAPR
jgi:hypothetical protein